MQKVIKNLGIASLYLVVLIAIMFSVFPIIYMLFASLKTNSEIMTNASNLIPVNPTFDNYKIAWNSDVFNVKRLVWNSLYYSTLVVAITVLTSSLAGYVFARGDFKGQKFWFVLFSSLMFVNFGGASIVPTLQIVKSLHLTGSLSGLIVVKMFSIGIVNIYLVRGFINAIPREVDEAAIVDGCSFFKIFTHIILPLLKPILATICMLGFQGSWNEYLMPLVFTITDPSKGTLVSGLFALKSSSAAATNWNILLAGSVVAAFPVIVVYFCLNKYFVSGLTAGAVKG